MYEVSSKMISVIWWSRVILCLLESLLSVFQLVKVFPGFNFCLVCLLEHPSHRQIYALYQGCMEVKIGYPLYCDKNSQSRRLTFPKAFMRTH